MELKVDKTIIDDHTGAIIEGGDIVQFQGIFFIGISSRTNEAGALLAERVIKHHLPEALVFLLRIINTKYYHLDTCFLPCKKFAIIAEDLDKLFDEPSTVLINQLWKGEKVIVASQYHDTPWKVCNARSFSNGIVVFSSELPAPLKERILDLDHTLNVVEMDLQEILVGGGGISCVTLSTCNPKDPIFLTNPSMCNLHKFSLNYFQPFPAVDTPVQVTRAHQQALCKEISKVKKVFEKLGGHVTLLSSLSAYPECIFVKDHAILLRTSAEIIVVPCKLKCAERKEEIGWFTSQVSALVDDVVIGDVTCV